MKKNKHIIKMVQPGSIAEELEIEPGDELISINDQKIEDVFDYHYLVNDDYLTVLIRKTNGEEWELEIEKDYEEDLGIEFDNGLMDEYRSLSETTVFSCFIFRRCRRGCGKLCILKTMIPAFLILQGN